MAIRLFFLLCCQLWLGHTVLQAAAAQTRQLTILQTTDIHCHVSGELANWLKLTTIIRRERARAGADNTILIDCGDTIAGTFAAAAAHGTIAVKMLNALHYDIWIPGNHDYDFGLTTLLRYQRQTPATMLAANLCLQDKKRPPFAAWKMLRKNGLKIAVIGLSLPESEKSYFPKPPFRVLPGMEVMAAVMREVRAAKPQIIVLAAHCGLYTADRMLQQIARHYPEIDIFLGGHTHLDFPGQRIGSRSWYVQSGKYALGVAKINLSFSLQRHSITKLTSEIIPTLANTPLDNSSLIAVGNQLNKIIRREDEIIGYTASPICAPAPGGGISSVARLVGKAINREVRSRAAFISGGREINIAPGPITRRQAFELYPYLDTVCTLMLTRAELIALMRELAAQHEQYHPVLAIGIELIYDQRGRIKGIKFSDSIQPLAAKQRYRIAFSSYVCSEIHPLPLLQRLIKEPRCQLNNSGIKIYQTVVDYIQSGRQTMGNGSSR